LFIFAFFELFTVAIQMGMSQKEIASASSNILQHMGVLLYGPTWGSIMVLAVSLSTIATLETSLLQITRTLFAMGRDGVISEKFGKIHPKWQTPYVSSIVITIVALLFFVLSNFLPSVNKVLTDAINAIGLQVIFYYGLTCLSVIVYYRRVLFKSVSNFVFLFLLPFIAAIFLLAVGIYDIPNLGRETVSIGIGLIVVGIIPLLWGRYKRASFFYQPRETFQPVQSSPDSEQVPM
jgi:amino acid transporter